MMKKVYAPGLVFVKDQWAEQPGKPMLLDLSEKLKKISQLCDYKIENQEIKEKLTDTEIILGGVEINKEFLGFANKLEFVQNIGVGFNHIDIEACTEHGVLVSNVAEIYTEAVAQHAWGLILSLTKKITKADKAMRARDWKSHNWMGFSVWGKTIGIVGLGNIGSRVAAKARLAFGMKVLAYDPYILPAKAQLFGAELVELDILLSESDIVVLCVPLNNETYHMIGDEQLSLMKKTGYLVNVCRGAVIEQNALIKQLLKNRIKGAALDVYEIEPIPEDNPLLEMNNVVLTPHIASSTKEAVEKTFNGAVSNVIRYIKGQKPYWIVNPQVWEHYRR
jgi:D-3-phosphoglycerate dehydrogenase